MPDEFEEQATEPLDWRYYLALGRRRIWYFLIPFFLGWLIVWGLSWVLPSVYRSGTLILVEQPTVPQQFVVSNVAGDLQQRLQSISQQILSRTRLWHIIENLNLYEKQRQRLTPDEVVAKMQKDIEIELVRDNRQELTAFNIYYSSRDPRTAQQVTSELSNLFISENLEVRQQQSESTTKFLESELEEARKGLTEQEDKVRRFKDQHLGELPGQLQSNLQILTGLQTQLQAEEDNLNRAKQQNVYLESLLTQYRTLQRSTKSGGTTQMGLPALDQELDQLKAKLADLSSHYTDRHPDVRKLKDQIARTERMRQQLSADLASGSTQTPADASVTTPRTEDDVRTSSSTLELQSQLKANQTEIANRQRAVQELEGRINQYQARLNQAPVREQELADLTRGYDQSRSNYDSLLKKKNDSKLATSLELQQQGEHFRILDPPGLPQKPFSPNRIKLCGLGLAAGLVLGVAGAGIAEFLDDRIYGDKALRKIIPVAVIAELPSIWTEQERTQQRKQAGLVWITAGLMFVCVLAGSAFSYFRG
jgi:polysaccharide biosynthesis transport protein